MENSGNRSNFQSKTVWAIYLLFCVCVVVILVRIADIQLNFRGSDPYLKYYTSRSRKEVLLPARGSIIASDGRLLAMSTPMYQIRMDCTVRKDEFLRDKDKGAEKERKWRDSAKELSKGLASIYGSSADEWYKAIVQGRDKGSRYLKIGGLIDHGTMLKVKALPLFNQGSNKGGVIVERQDTRQYPYGALARSTIGYVKDNAGTDSRRLGIEGAFDYYLHGKEGYEWMKPTDGRKSILDKDSTAVAPEDGMDIRTTIDIDIQDIADNALRNHIGEDEDIECGCAVVMDVKTGAIRAMVNLMRDSTSGALRETYNLAVRRKGEPGSVFKTVTLTSLLEDRMVKMTDEIPSNHGRVEGFREVDDHVVQYEREHHTDKVPVMYGYEVSSNYVFRKLAIDNYGSNPKKFIDNIYLYKLGEAFQFDLPGLASPTVPSPGTSSWYGTSLGSIAVGYSVDVTPLHIVTFYNAIANKGRMMKPYLIESIEKDGEVKEKRGPAVLNGAICSRATADSLTRGLMNITEVGTGARMLKNAKFKVAGKTGTARIALDSKTARPGNRYEDISGRKKNQGTFVGFFPAENPRYTAIVVIYSTLSHKSHYGGSAPAATYKEIVDNIYALDTESGEVLGRTGRMPRLSSEKPQTARNGKVPGLRGLGLMDAIYAIENDGYKCLYTGTGHVVSQSPAPGASLAAGGVISITLK